MRKTMLVMACLALAVAAAAPIRAQEPERINDHQVKSILVDLDRASAGFRKSLDHSLDRSRLDGTRREDAINDFVKSFAKATDRLREKFGDHNQASGLARDVLVSAQDIDRFVATHDLDARTHDDWSRVRGALDQLADAYSVTWNWEGTPVVDRVGDKDVKSLLGRLESRADAFRKSLDAALDKSEVNGSGYEDEINRYMKDFERATDTWKSHFGDHDTAATDAAEVLGRAREIDRFMAAHPLTDRAQRDWADLRVSLDELARAYNVEWNW